MMPMWQGSLGARCLLSNGLSLHTLSQFIGRMYHDVSNTRELMWTLTHDVALDYANPTGMWKIGASISNLTNVTSTKIIDTVSGGTDGRVAFSRYNGDPLPGRALLLSASAEI